MWENFKYWLKHHNYEWKFKLTVILPIFVVLVLADIISKIVIQVKFQQGAGTQNPGGKLVTFYYIIHPGSGAWESTTNVGLVVAINTIITLIVLGILIFVNDKMWLFAIVFFFSGTFADLIARAWAPAVTKEGAAASGYPSWEGVKGGVIDFLDTDLFGWRFNNNLADIWVSIACVLIVVFVIVEIVRFAINAHKEKQAELLSLEPVKKLSSNATKQEVEADIERKEARIKYLRSEMKLRKMDKNEHKSN